MSGRNIFFYGEGIMEKKNFEACITDVIKEVINCISEKNYDSLNHFVTVDDEWLEEDETQEDGISRFEEWMEEQLEAWSEDIGEEFVIDPFDEEYLEIDFDDEDDSCAFATYTPTSDEEDLDLWFEFRCTADDDEKVTVSFTVNM